MLCFDLAKQPLLSVLYRDGGIGARVVSIRGFLMDVSLGYRWLLVMDYCREHAMNLMSADLFFQAGFSWNISRLPL